MEYINTPTTPEKLYLLCTKPVRKELDGATIEKRKEITEIVNNAIEDALKNSSVLTKFGVSDIIKRALK